MLKEATLAPDSSVDPSKPLQDRFSVTPTSSSGMKDVIDVTVSCELMSNSLAGMPGQ